MIKNAMILSIKLIVILCFLTFFHSLSQASVTISIGNGSGLPGSSKNPVEVSLDNPDEAAKGVQMDVCDVDDFLGCTECETTSRTSDFMCTINELPNGCCRVVLFPTNPGALIDTGTGPILTLKYNVSEAAPAGECRDLNPENAMVSDENNSSLHVTSVPGEFCFDYGPKIISEPYLILPPDFPALSTDINSPTTIQDHVYIFWIYSDDDPSGCIHWAAAHNVDLPWWGGWYSFDTYTYNLFGYDIWFSLATIDPDDMNPGTYMFFYSVTDSTGQEAKSWDTYPDTQFYFRIE